MLKANFINLTTFVLITFLSACVRPNRGLSPFTELAEQETVLPTADLTHNTPVNGPGFIIIPDSELVFSPSCVGFDFENFVLSASGFLSRYQEEVEEETLSGKQIVNRISHEYSVNPRILLALLEYQSGWVTEEKPQYQGDYPLGYSDPWRKGLFRQLSYVANELNRGYYLHAVDALSQLTSTDGQVVYPAEQLNGGTAGLQYLLGLLKNYHDWELAVSPLGFYAVYVKLFGDPNQYDFGLVVPQDLTQPAFQLPFAEGETWYFTGGPHSAWGNGAAWAALDFAPPGEQFGCYESDSWLLAVADGQVVRSENGAVVLDLDGDGYEQTGWTVLYMHIAEKDRVAVGASLTAGDRIGHPSCEGGPATGTHVHIARRYNGEWIPADQDLPFNLNGWISKGFGVEYDGKLVRGEEIIQALGYPADENKISW